MENFWDNKPVNVITTSPIKRNKQILPIEDAFININREIENSRVKLDYVVYNESTTEVPYENITNFINKNYIVNEYRNSIYTIELIKFYSKDCLIIEFYPPNKKTAVGYVFGRRHKISIFDNIIDTLEVNFLCIIPSLRSMNLATYMINVISRECVINYNIPTAHYTVGKEIRSPFFSEKKIYRRFINILKLYDIKYINTAYNISLYMNKLTRFLYTKDFNNLHSMQYINNNVDFFSKEKFDNNSDLIKELYDKLINYNKKTYDIFECITFENYIDTHNCKDFHHFIIRNNDNKILNYFLILNIETHNKTYKRNYTNGYFYNMFFNSADDIINSIELVNEFIYSYKLFDMTTIIDIFDIDYRLLNIYETDETLKYYFFNMMITPIMNHKNNLFTI